MSMNALVDALTDINLLSSFLMDYLLVLLAAGILSMLLLEGFKGVLDAKALFHRRALRHWFREDFTQSTPVVLQQPGGGVPGDSESFQEAFEELEQICTGMRQRADRLGLGIFALNGRLALYSLRTGQLIGKVQKAFENVLQNPDLGPRLFEALTKLEPGTAGHWKAYLRYGAKPEAMEPDGWEKAQREHAVLLERMNARLDTLQINMEHAWGRMNRCAGALIGAVLLSAFFSWAAQAFTLQSIVLALPGGAAAPAVKHVVAALRNLASHRQWQL